MRKICILFASQIFILGSLAFASDNGLEFPQCKGVTDVCMAANVSAKDSKTGQMVQGYQPGEHNKDHNGLWVDCVAKIAHGKTVAGVSGVNPASAQACLQAKNNAHHR